MPQPAFTVSVTTRFLPEQSDPGSHGYAFAYTITVRNTGDVPAQLIGRRWLIVDANGKTQEVRGLGVVGNQPLLQPGEEFEYTSWTRIPTPRGHMQGTYFCMTDAAQPFEAEIPRFDLSVAQALH